MKLFKPLIAAVLVIAGLVTVGASPSGSQTAEWKYFEADGTVGKADATGFTMTGVTSNVTGAGSTISVRRHLDTKFYGYNPSSNQWEKSTYEAVVKVGETVRATGRYANVEGNYEFVANFVWSPPPPPPTSTTPPNPAPVIPRDYALQRTFTVEGVPTQSGMTLTNSFGWSESWGFVIGNLSLVDSDHVGMVAAAHHGQIPMTVTLQTKYWIQQSDGSYQAASKDQAVYQSMKYGTPMVVSGRYTFADLDWRFFANYVTVPRPEVSYGSFHFAGSTARSSTGVSTETGGWYRSRYDGSTTAGDSQVNPGPLVFRLDWEFDPNRGLWIFTGTWEASHSNNLGRLSGTISGEWVPTTSRTNGAMSLDEGTGIWAGVTGSGTFTGNAVMDASSSPTPPPLTFDVSVQLRVVR